MPTQIQVRSSTNTLLTSFTLTGAAGPFAVAVDGGGFIYVSALQSNLVQKYASNGTFVGNIASLAKPRGLAFDAAGKLYVVTSGSLLRCINSTPPELIRPLSSLAAALFAIPRFLAFDTLGRLYVSNTGASSGCPVGGSSRYYAIANGVASDRGKFVAVNGSLQGPNQMAFGFDAADNFGSLNCYVADYARSNIHRFGVTSDPLTTGADKGLYASDSTTQFPIGLVAAPPPSSGPFYKLSAANGIGGGAWTSVSATGPVQRHGHTSVYDPSRDRLLLFGGYTSTLEPVNDVWALNTVSGTPSWTWLKTNNPAIPARTSHAAVFDPASDNGCGRMIVYGGYGAVNNLPSLHDVWVLTQACSSNPTWVQLNPSGGPPAASGDTAYAYDPASNELIVAGGSIDGSATAPTTFDVWVLTHANGLGGVPQWVKLNVSGTPPGTRWGMVSAYDPAANALMFFGGLVPANSSCTGGLDQACRYVDNSVWVLTHANGLGGNPAWVNVTSPGGPPLRTGATSIYDSTNRVFTIFGGVGLPGGSFQKDTWAWTGISSVSGACSYNLTATSTTVASAASNGSFGVLAPPGCNWTAAADPSAPWLKITSGATGSGNGTVNFSVDPNTLSLSRSGVITVAGQSYTVTQTGVTCFYSYTPTSQSLTSAGGPGSFNITTSPGCAWTVASNAAFISTPSPATGTGNGTVNYTAGATQEACRKPAQFRLPDRGFRRPSPSPKRPSPFPPVTLQSHLPCRSCVRKASSN